MSDKVLCSERHSHGPKATMGKDSGLQAQACKDLDMKVAEDGGSKFALVSPLWAVLQSF